jgi:hypothetical protein
MSTAAQNDVVEHVLFCGLVALAAGFFFIAREAASAQAEAERQTQEDIARESAQFCGSLGIPPGTHAFIVCTMGLNRIRENEADRVASVPRLP